VEISSSAARPGPVTGSRSASRPSRTGTVSRSAAASSSAARAGSRTSTVSSAVPASAASAACAVPPAPSSTARSATTPRSASASVMPVQSVLSAYQPDAPGSGSSVLPAPIAAAIGLIRSATRNTVRLSGMVAEKPAASGYAASTRGRSSSAHSIASYRQPVSPSAA